ncbi:uncharacterized protein A4U43_C04F19040 [Asparagus officinalis]|uniref:Uncharacterized protein n=1 Tax=Asparagus officinalis TaxID=4686 RepID=A0A5P1F6V5_ASPOF|nr:uncharacterized protein A4U43_C04F19040 [Asparagus officinalis]
MKASNKLATTEKVIMRTLKAKAFVLGVLLQDVGETDLQTILTHSIPSGHSTVGGDASASTSIARPLHLRNYRPNRAAKRAEKRAENIGEQIYKSRQYMDFPIYKNWGPDHERSFDKFFLQAQKDYEFLPVDPYCPLNIPAIHRGVKIKMQERVRGNRNQVKKECYELWLETPQEKRDDLFKTETEAKRNKDNRESKKRGRATYTGGSRSMVRAKERVRARIEESGGSSSALKEYLGTHATLVDPGADTYSCTYPDTQTQEYCVDYHTAHPPSAKPSPGAQGSASAQPSPGAQETGASSERRRGQWKDGFLIVGNPSNILMCCYFGVFCC